MKIGGTVTHELKCWPDMFADVAYGTKNFEVRRWDRQFAVGDTLRLREWDPHDQEYSGKQTERVIAYIMPGGQFGIDEHFCVLGLAAALNPPSASRT